MTPEQREDWRFRMQIISTLGILTAAFSLLISWYSFSTTQSWNRSVYTVNLIGALNKDTAEFRDILRRNYSKLRLPNSPLTEAEVVALINDPEKDPEKQAMIQFLNYCVTICAAYERGLLDKPVAREQFGFILTYCENLDLFIERMHTHLGGTPWEVIRRVSNRWKNNEY